MKHWIWRVTRCVLPIAILAWLVYSLGRDNPDEVWRIVRGPKDWPRIATAFLVCLTGVILTFFRWYLLVRGLGVRFRLNDAYRLGFIGYFFNFVSLGSVGGDLFKMLFVMREQPGSRTEVVGSIVVDRAIGLYSLLLLASLASFALLTDDAGPETRVIVSLIWGSFIAGTLILALFFANFLSLRRLGGWLANFPRIAAHVFRLETGFQLYRRHRAILTSAILLGVVSHTLYGLCLYLLATGLFTVTPTLTEHFVMWPLAGAFSSLPMTPAGVGTFELAVSELYRTLPRAAASMLPHTGTIVGLAYRLLTMLIAAIGIAFYLFRRRQVDQVWHQADEDSALLDTPTGRAKSERDA